MKKIAKDNIYLYDYNSTESFCLEYYAPFKGFTELQKYIFLTKQFWNYKQNIIIKGMPGAGKTLLAEIAFLSVPLKSGEEKRKLLYLVPYRALLNEKYIYFLNRFNRSCYRIYRSSSDYFDNDENIIRANCDIAIMIYEKLDNALRCLPNSSNLFYDYDLIVMDEFSLISSLDRGIVINSILKRYESLSEWHENKRKARVLALTVPECRTSEYNQQGFLTMMNDSRPVDIYEAIIQADRGIVIPKNIDMEWPISYEKLNNIVLTNHMDEKRQKRDEINDMDEFEYYESKELLPYLIKAHRKRNHHIIIFCSSRENVRNLSNSISKMIFKNKIPHGDWSERLISIQRNMGDNSYGCIDDKMILSAKYGVTYHNSDLPIELRREITMRNRRTPRPVCNICGRGTMTQRMATLLRKIPRMESYRSR